MSQFKEYKEDALSILDVLRNTYAMDNDDQDAIYLESAILGMEEQYEILQNGLPQAIDQELKWNKKHKPELFTRNSKIPIKHMIQVLDGDFTFSPFKCRKRASALV